MLIRWLLVGALVLGLLITALELSAASRPRRSARQPASVADVVTGRGEEPSLPSVPEVDQTPPSPSPALTY
jgi:hypothetical protein